MKKQLILLGVVFVSAVWVLFQLDFSATNFLPPPPYRRHFISSALHREERTSGFLVNTEGCRIQDLDAFDKSIKQFITPEKPPACEKYNKYGRLVKADADSLYIDWTVLENVTNSQKTKSVNCKYCEFWRVEFPYHENGTYPRTVDTTSRFSSDCKTISNRTYINDEEFIQVDCFLGNEKIYSDYFSFPSTKKNRMKKTKKSDEVSVLIIGIDAVSRLNLHRQMPKTVHFLKNQIQSIEMLGYNKIGDNTFPNLVAVLSGLTVDELSNTCWQNMDDIFDNCPFIWKKYKNSGFHTAYAEDSAQIGLFNYQKTGFRKQPTDYYGQIFSLVSEGKLGHEKRLNTHLCIGNRLTVDVLLESARHFAVRLKDVLTWGMFWSTSLSHDYLNLPRYGDFLHLNFLETLEYEGIFKTSIVIVLSDHGIRWGGIRETYQGYIEERLPVLFITFPEWFESRYPLAVRNLRTNKRRLTTPFDLHETLLDLIDLGNIENIMVKRRSETSKQTMTRGISLFLAVPENRKCKDAGITDNWCTCHTSKTLNTEDSTVKYISSILIDHLNNLLQGYIECSKLHLYKIHSARTEEVALGKDEEKADKDKLTDYFIVVETRPGNGMFEATIRYSNNSKPTVIDPVSRINTYGNQSKCISHYALKLYCYCII